MTQPSFPTKLKQALKPYLLGALDFAQLRVTTQVSQRHAHSLLTLALVDAFSRIQRAFLHQTTVKIATVGYDTQLFANTEAIRDGGLEIVSFHNVGTEKRYFYNSTPLEELDLTTCDAIMVCADSPKKALIPSQALITGLSQLTPPTPIFNFSKLRFAFQHTLQQLKSHRFGTCLNPVKLAAITIALAQKAGEGCIIECGTYLGGTTLFMGCLLRVLSDPRIIHSFDTFEGMPTPQEADGETVYQAGLFQDTSLKLVTKHVRAHKLSGQIQLHQGLVQDTLPQVVATETEISFALLDTDQYSGTLAGLQMVLPKLNHNGIIFVDDYSVSGVKQAVDEVMAIDSHLNGALITFNFYMLWKK